MTHHGNSSCGSVRAWSDAPWIIRLSIAVLAALGCVIALFHWSWDASPLGVETTGPIMSLILNFPLGIEREIAAQAETTGEQIAQLTARLDELDRAAEEVRITRKTLLELPGPQPPVPPAPKLPDHPAYQQIMAVFAAADAPLRARQVCEAMDLEIAPNNINNTRLKLKRLTERGILVEDRARLVHPATAVAARPRGQPACPSRKGETDINSRTASHT